MVHKDPAGGDSTQNVPTTSAQPEATEPPDSRRLSPNAPEKKPPGWEKQQEPINYEPVLTDEAVINQPAILFHDVPDGAIPSVPELPPVEGCLKGLEPLYGISLFFMRREVLEWPSKAPGGSKLNNRFTILNQFGHRIFFAGEELSKRCCTPESFRPFVLHFFDPRGRLIMRVERPQSTALSYWGADIYGNNLSVTLHTVADDAVHLGGIEQCFGSVWCSNVGHFRVVRSPSSTPILRLKGSWKSTFPLGPWCYGYPEMDVNISLSSADGSQVLVDPFLRENKLDSGEKLLGIQVPPSMDCELKAILIGFLMDVYITFFEGGEVRKFVVDMYGHPYLTTNKHRRGCTGWRCTNLTFLVIVVAMLAVAAILLYFYLRPSQRETINEVAVSHSPLPVT